MFSRRCAVWAMMCLALHARGQAIDSLISSPGLWRMQRADFARQARGLGFYWLSASKDRAETHSKGVTLFLQPVCEVDADFQGDTVAGLTVSIYNRGDAGDLTREQMTALMQRSIGDMTTLTKVQAVYKGQEASNAVKAYAFEWQTPASDFLLEYSQTEEVKSRNIPFRAEFVRLRITPAEKPKSFLAEALGSASPQAAFDGPSHVKKDASGDVQIDTVPMVDQGQKGYCVVATAERVMRYYGVPVDENEMAELADTSATEGTSNKAMLDSLKKLSQRLQLKIRLLDAMDDRQFTALLNDYNRRMRASQEEISLDDPDLTMAKVYGEMKPDILKLVRTYNKADVDRFQQMVRDHIDQGIPILWCVMLGVMPEVRMPKVVAGHMRLIIGYNAGTNEILYSDSWGPGNELKRMRADNAWTITTDMDTIQPL